MTISYIRNDHCLNHGVRDSLREALAEVFERRVASRFNPLIGVPTKKASCRSKCNFQGTHNLKNSIEIRRRSEEHTSELQSQSNLVCRLLVEKKKNKKKYQHRHT